MKYIKANKHYALILLLVITTINTIQTIESTAPITITPTTINFWDRISTRLNNSQTAIALGIVSITAIYAGYRYYRQIMAPDYIERARSRARATRNLQFINAVRLGDIARVRDLLADRANIDINSQDNRGMTALMYATQSAHINIIPLLIAANANVNLRDNHGMTALLISVALHTIQDQEQILPLLINARADINLTNNNGFTALMYAARNGHQSIVTLLLANHANIFAVNNQGFTALHQANSNQHPAIIVQLVRHRQHILSLAGAAAGA